jgi:hypothetical protein
MKKMGEFQIDCEPKDVVRMSVPAYSNPHSGSCHDDVRGLYVKEDV